MDPEYLLARSNLASTLALLGKAEEAVHELRRIAVTDPGFATRKMRQDQDYDAVRETRPFKKLLAELGVMGERLDLLALTPVDRRAVEELVQWSFVEVREYRGLTLALTSGSFEGMYLPGRLIVRYRGGYFVSAEGVGISDAVYDPKMGEFFVGMAFGWEPSIFEPLGALLDLEPRDVLAAANPYSDMADEPENLVLTILATVSRYEMDIINLLPYVGGEEIALTATGIEFARYSFRQPGCLRTGGGGRAAAWCDITVVARRLDPRTHLLLKDDRPTEQGAVRKSDQSRFFDLYSDNDAEQLRELMELLDR